MKRYVEKEAGNTGPEELIPHSNALTNFLTVSTLAADLAEVSRKTRPFSCAKSCPSCVLTARRCSRSLLLPISMIVMFGLPFWRASSSHRPRWLKLSRRVMSYTNRAPAASR